jgi:hypothetical protein
MTTIIVSQSLTSIEAATIHSITYGIIGVYDVGHPLVAATVKVEDTSYPILVVGCY